MKKRLLSKIFGLGMAVSLIGSVSVYSETEAKYIPPRITYEEEVNDSRATANEFSKYDHITYVHGDVTAGDVDYFKLIPEVGHNDAKYVIYVGGGSQFTFELVDSKGIPTRIDSWGKIEVDISSEQEYYLKVTTGIAEELHYTITAYRYNK